MQDTLTCKPCLHNLGFQDLCTAGSTNPRNQIHCRRCWLSRKHEAHLAQHKRPRRGLRPTIQKKLVKPYSKLKVRAVVLSRGYSCCAGRMLACSLQAACFHSSRSDRNLEPKPLLYCNPKAKQQTPTLNPSPFNIVSDIPLLAPKLRSLLLRAPDS